METHTAQPQKKRNETLFNTSQIEIEKLHESMNKGEIELAFYDEAGFNQTSPNRNSWTLKSETHHCEARRGKRLNVLGAMLSSGKLFTYLLENPTTSMDFVGFMGLLLQTVSKPLVVILDNASIHKAKNIMPLLKVLAAKGLTLYFLPPYCPELNRIEILWRKIKYKWLEFKTRDIQTLESDLNEIRNNFGTTYNLSFTPKIRKNLTC